MAKCTKSKIDYLNATEMNPMCRQAAEVYANEKKRPKYNNLDIKR